MGFESLFKKKNEFSQNYFTYKLKIFIKYLK
jgi:hypothetical protein